MVIATVLCESDWNRSKCAARSFVAHCVADELCSKVESGTIECDYGVFRDSHAPINALHCIQSVLDEAQVLESLDMQSRSTSSWTIEMSRGFFC